MSEPVKNGAMRHYILKVAALALASVAGLLVVCWAFSLSNDPKSAQLAFGKDPSYACLALGRGHLIVCDHFDNREAIRLLDNLTPTRRGVSKDVGTSLPGFTFRHLTLSSGQRIWSLEISLLIPAMATTLFAGLFLWILRIRPGIAHSVEPPNESMQRTAILCPVFHRS